MLEIGAQLAEPGHKMLDAPVTGSSPTAEDGTLPIPSAAYTRQVLTAAMGLVMPITTSRR